MIWLRLRSSFMAELLPQCRQMFKCVDKTVAVFLELFPEKNAFGFDFADAPGFKDGDDVQRVGAAEEILD